MKQNDGPIYVYNIAVAKEDSKTVETDTMFRAALVTAQEVQEIADTLNCKVGISLIGTFIADPEDIQKKYTFVANPKKVEVQENEI